MRALILSEDGLTVENVLIVSEGVDPAEFGAVPAPEGLVSIGWTLEDGVWSAPSAPLPSPEGLKAYAAAKRLSVETGGITVAGSVIATDRQSQAMISGADAYVQSGGAETVTFKSSTGWVTLPAAEMHAIALAVAAHVQACFTAEKAVDDAIDAETITTIADVDAADWPA